MKKNILLSLVGVLLGFFLGFFIANMGGRERLAASMASANNSARSPAPGQDGQLPPGHPNIGDDAGGASATAQAEAVMDEADRNPKDFAAQMRAAVIFFQLGSYDKSTLYLNRSLALKPDDPDALTGMGQIKYQAGDYDAAATYFEKVLAKHPDDADLRTDLGDTYAKRTSPDYARAITEYRKALELDPKNEHALEQLAAAALLKGDKTTARDAVDKLAAVNSSNPALSTLRSKLDGK